MFDAACIRPHRWAEHRPVPSGGAAPGAEVQSPRWLWSKGREDEARAIEVVPTEVRGIGTGFATAVGRVGAGLDTFLLPIGIEHFGVSAAMLVAAVVVFSGALVSQLLGAGDEGESLSETAAGYSHRPIASRATRGRSTAWRGGVADERGRCLGRPNRVR